MMYERTLLTLHSLNLLQQQGLAALSNKGQIRQLPLFDRFFGRILPSRWHLSYLPTTRHALDIYTAYNHAQATQVALSFFPLIRPPTRGPLSVHRLDLSSCPAYEC